MSSFHEKAFIVNGVKSWIHCLELYRDAPSPSEHFQSLEYHYHDYIEFLYALEADACVWLGGEKHLFQTGDLAIINSQEMHTLSFFGKTHYICVKFSPHILYTDDNALFEFKYVLPFLYGSAHQSVFRQTDLTDTDLKGLVLEIMNEWNSNETAREMIMRADILRIFAAIFRYWQKNPLIGSPFSSPDATLPHPIKTALLFISENYDSVTEHQVADACGLSYNHFSASFKSTVGRNFNDYITLYRLSEAEKLLLSTDRSVTDIALSCGFSSASHFIDRFKSHKQITPHQFRLKVRESVREVGETRTALLSDGTSPKDLS